MKNILVTIDFDINTKLLVDQAVKLSKAFDSKLWLVHIASPDPKFVGYGVGPQYIRNFIAKELKEEHMFLHEQVKEIRLKGIEAEGLLIQGATIEMIISESKKLKIDLIIAGHHEHGILYSTIVGSISNGIIKESKIPVLIIPLND
jgi:nucleotide-binding universal stress UspA family protein